jgi:superfamily II DNA or RNA helicase
MKDSTRTSKQLEIVETWRKGHGMGTVVAATGFGKTRVAILAIQRFVKLDVNARVVIVVPTLNLQDQWIKELQAHKVNDNCEVVVVNTAYKNTYKCDVLVLDEIHCYGAPQFKKIFKTISYDYILGLTATIERSDGKHDILLEHCPIIAEVTIDECYDNGWVSPYKVYNLAVPMLPEEVREYEKANSRFRWAAGLLGGGGSATFRLAQQILKDNRSTPDQKAAAGTYFNSIRERGQVCKNSKAKLPIINEIITKFSDRKALIFSDSTAFADELKELLGDQCLSFHSKQTKKVRAEILKKFKDGRTKQRVISAVKALNAGFDVPDCSLGIVAAGNSKKLDNIQRTGRIIRYVPGKEAIIINLYAPDTQEVTWLTTRQEGQEVVWVESVDEIGI